MKPKEERDLRMKVCGNCGREAQDESMFCKYCGARLDQPVQEEAHQEGARQRKFCPNCGGSLEGAVDFCPNCGERLRGEAGGGAQGRSPQDVRKGVRKPGGKVWKIAGAVAGLCLAAVLVVWLAGTVFASPAKKFAAYQEKTLQALFVDGLAEAAEAYNQYMHLSTDMTLTASSSDQELERYLEDSAIELKVEMGEDSALINSALTLLGSQVVTADLTYDKGVAGFYIPELDDTYYTVDLAELDEGFGPELENLKNTEIPVKDLEKLARSIVDTLSSEFYTRATVGIGTPVTGIKDLARSFKEAQVALEVGKVFDTDEAIVSYDNLGIARLIYQLPTTLCETFLKEVFKQGSIDSLDQETLFTIHRFFENNLNVSETSRKLFVHRNTLVYRLEKIKKLTGLDLREFDHAIVFKIALMVKKYLTSNPVKF